MELIFTEIEEVEDTPLPNRFETYFSSSMQPQPKENYTVQPQQPQPQLQPYSVPTKKTMVYSDILKNMNLVVVNGKLEFGKKNVHFSSDEEMQRTSFINNHNNYNNNTNTNTKTKNEYEYLKQQYPNLTKKDFLKKKVIDYFIYRKEMARVASIKSPKLLLTAGNTPLRREDLPSIRNLNSLFSLKN